MTRQTLVLLTAILLFGGAVSGADMLVAVKSYQAGDYRSAAVGLRDVIADLSQVAYHGDASLLLAKSHLNLGQLDEAEAALEHYLGRYEGHRSYHEGAYLRGRLLYLQGEYEASIIAFQRFVKGYPDSTFTANAYYWIGEALFSLGHLDEATVLFKAVVQDYPTSAKAEAARYKSSLIDLHKREAELLELLKLSHQETLKAIQEFEKREQTYEQAMTGYQRRLANDGSDSEQLAIRLEHQLNERDAQLRALRSQIDALTKQLAEANIEAVKAPDVATAAPAQDIELRMQLLRAKERALESKAYLLDELRREVE